MLIALRIMQPRLGNICERICSDHKVTFKGFDFSPAPYPADWCSLGKALELMGITNLGMNGSLTAAAILASTLDSGKWKRTGFNGLMLAVLEDSVLAERAASGCLTIKDLLLYSAVCGTGLDTIPLPGDASDRSTRVSVDGSGRAGNPPQQTIDGAINADSGKTSWR